jgi:hypothetical protein
VNSIREKLTYANVVSSLCLFLLLSGGAAYAASHLGKNSVGPKQLKKNAVTSAKIKNGAVTGAKVKVATLGKVPSASFADNAGAIGGIGPSGLLGSDHLLTGHGSVAVTDGTIFSDPRTGLTVTTSPKGGPGGRLGLVNTNSSDSINVAVIGFYNSEPQEQKSVKLAPGKSTAISFSAANFTYGIFAAQRVSPTAQTVAFTCMRPEEEYSCVGIG